MLGQADWLYIDVVVPSKLVRIVAAVAGSRLGRVVFVAAAESTAVARIAVAVADDGAAAVVDTLAIAAAAADAAAVADIDRELVVASAEPASTHIAADVTDCVAAKAAAHIDRKENGPEAVDTVHRRLQCDLFP